MPVWENRFDAVWCARLAQSVERKALNIEQHSGYRGCNLVVVGSSPTVGESCTRGLVVEYHPATVETRVRFSASADGVVLHAGVVVV